MEEEGTGSKLRKRREREIEQEEGGSRGGREGSREGREEFELQKKRFVQKYKINKSAEMFL